MRRCLASRALATVFIFFGYFDHNNNNNHHRFFFFSSSLRTPCTHTLSTTTATTLSPSCPHPADSTTSFARLLRHHCQHTHPHDIPQLHPHHQSSSTSSIPCALSKQHSALLHCEASLDVTRSPPSSVCPALPCPALFCPVITIIIIIFIIFTHSPIAP